MSELTGGGPLNEPRDAFLTARRRSRIAVDIWPWMVGLVAVLIVPEIALRRLGPAAFLWIGRIGRRRENIDG
jgi:hypothetical protein